MIIYTSILFCIPYCVYNFKDVKQNSVRIQLKVLIILGFMFGFHFETAFTSISNLLSFNMFVIHRKKFLDQHEYIDEGRTFTQKSLEERSKFVHDNYDNSINKFN